MLMLSLDSRDTTFYKTRNSWDSLGTLLVTAFVPLNLAETGGKASTKRAAKPPRMERKVLRTRQFTKIRHTHKDF